VRRTGPLVVLAGSGAAGAVLSWVIAQHSLLGARWHLLGFMAVWVVVWVPGAWAAGRVPDRRVAVGAVLVVAVGLRLLAATGTSPSISADLYRYGWDAKVQLSGVDPYRYPPRAPELAHLQAPPWFPSPAGCGHIGKRPGCTTIDRADVRTIYPPVAEAWFDAVHVVWPGREGSRPWQLAGGLADEATVVLLAVLLARSGRDPRRVAWYALSPVPVIEYAGNGHVDYLGLLFLVAALQALLRQRRGWAGFLIGLATMVKLYPAIAVIAAWRQGRTRMLAFFAATVLVCELPHVIAVGPDLLGYLPGYLREEHYESGTRYLLVGLLPLPSVVITTLAALLVGVVVARVLRSTWEPVTGLCVLFATVVLVASPVQPWYAVALAALGVAAGAPWLVLPALLAEPYYAAVILDSSHQVAIGRACYGLALAGIAAGLAQRRQSGTGGRVVDVAASRRWSRAGSAPTRSER
jgi:hypothetical protein